MGLEDLNIDSDDAGSDMQEDTPYESTLGKAMGPSSSVQAYSDKLLATDNIEKIQNLIKKGDLTREELLELQALLAGQEIKLVNFTEWERFLCGKLLVWIQDLIKTIEFLSDYITSIKKNKDISVSDKEQMLLLLDESKKIYLYDITTLMNSYLYIIRSSMSKDGYGFDSMSKQRGEYQYTHMNQTISPEPEKKPFLLNIR